MLKVAKKFCSSCGRATPLGVAQAATAPSATEGTRKSISSGREAAAWIMGLIITGIGHMVVGRIVRGIIILLGAFYRELGDSYKKQAKKQAKARRVRFKAMVAQNALDRTLNKMPVAVQAFGEGTYGQYAHSKYWYIDKLLQTPLEDYRKRSIDLLLAPFLITVKGMHDAIAMNNHELVAEM